MDYKNCIPYFKKKISVIFVETDLNELSSVYKTNSEFIWICFKNT